MEQQKEKLLKEKLDLSIQLKQLRKDVKNKRNDVSDLQQVLQQDLERMRSYPIYCYLLLFLHYVFILYCWTNQKTFFFLLHTVQCLWFIRGWYRQIYMRLAVPISLMLLILTLVV